MYAHIIVTNCAPHIAGLFPYWYGFPFMAELQKDLSEHPLISLLNINCRWPWSYGDWI